MYKIRSGMSHTLALNQMFFNLFWSLIVLGNFCEKES